MLQLKNIRKAYKTESFTQVALNDVSISFRDNEFVAILGPSGSGKTTLLNIVGGLDHYDSGDLVIDGTSTKEYKDRDWDTYRNNRIGFVFQSYNLIPHQSVLANVELALTLSGVGKEERRNRAIEALTKVGLGEHIDKRPSQLSGGQMQRVAIARALINNPEILLADEPTGALDSKTSVQIMDLLTEIAADRLVIMVTHNPDLAEEYANRIIELHDGVVESDTNPYNPFEEAKLVREKRVRRTSMSFLTALALSFNNLMTKKGRTIMTAFAGSIGIIGIAAILALANGVNNYIDNVEEETLSEYPLQITSTGFDMTSMLTNSADSATNDSDKDKDSSEKDSAKSQNKVKVISLVTSMFGSIESNDLKSLKTYLDSGTSGIEEYTNAIEYTYNVSPQVFLSDTSNGVHQVNPDSSFAALGMGSSSTSSVLSSMYSTDVFYEMPEETSLYLDQYEVLAGHWPENYNECVLVTTQGGSISDFMLYAMGLRDQKELKDMLTQFMDGENVTAPTDIRDYTYDELLDITFKVVNASDFYEYDSTYNVWKDRSDDETFMKSLVEDGEDLHIVGIVAPAEGQKITMLDSGINYTPALTKHLIENASTSSIVKSQIADSKTDVITGETFTALADEQTSSFDMESLFSIDEDKLASAFNIDQDAFTLDLDAVANAVSAQGLPEFPQPEEDEIGLNVDDTALNAISQTSYFLMTTFAAEQGKSLTDPTFSAEFAAWFATDPEITIPDTEDPTDLTKATKIGAKTYMQGVVATTTGISDFTVDFTTYLTRAVSQYTQELIATVMTATATSVAEQFSSAMTNAISLDENAFSDAFTINLEGDDLTEVITSMMNTEDRTYANNLRDFGYAEMDNPAEIDIYPKDFASKENITAILDAYNDTCKEAGEDDKVISYTDIVGALMSSVTTIVNMISYVLIAFVAISLVVSSIMIGVITYISVLERKKEIGILRSIGASKKDIRRVFNAETVIEGLIAGVLGIAVTVLLCIPANIIVESMFNVPNIALLPPTAAVVLILISVFLTFVSGLIPSSSAARQDPVEALRSE